MKFKNLKVWGWQDFFEKQIADRDLESEGLRPARVVGVEREWFRLETGEDQSRLATASGKLRFDSALWPAVGDWVLYRGDVSDGSAIVHEVLNRKTALRRKVPGKNLEEQMMATNVEYLFVATSLNEDFNLNRLERYLTLARDAGAEPIVLLTKCDLFPTRIKETMTELNQRFQNVEVFSISVHEPETVHVLKKFLRNHQTVVILGSSGVGKSTLVNHLLGESKLKTQESRSGDDKGRHTTTSRYLVRTPDDGLIIDTPGMRELQIFDHLEGVEKNFEDIEAVILRCRFSDCRHESEPNCAVKTALDTGEIDVHRWKAYEKLQAELRHLQRKQNKEAASLDKKSWKKINQTLRQKLKIKRPD